MSRLEAILDKYRLILPLESQPCQANDHLLQSDSLIAIPCSMTSISKSLLDALQNPYPQEAQLLIAQKSNNPFTDVSYPSPFSRLSSAS